MQESNDPVVLEKVVGELLCRCLEERGFIVGSNSKKVSFNNPKFKGLVMGCESPCEFTVSDKGNNTVVINGLATYGNIVADALGEAFKIKTTHDGTIYLQY